jgi:hypothetical protein
VEVANYSGTSAFLHKSKEVRIHHPCAVVFLDKSASRRGASFINWLPTCFAFRSTACLCSISSNGIENRIMLFFHLGCIRGRRERMERTLSFLHKGVNKMSLVANLNAKSSKGSRVGCAIQMVGVAIRT